MLGELLTQIEQLWHVPVRLSPRSAAWVACYWWLRSPLLWRGRVRRYTADGRDGKRLSVLTIGRETRTAWFCEDIATGLEFVGDEGMRPLTAPAALADLEADLVVVDIHPASAAAFRSRGWIIVPSGVRWCGDPALMPPRGSRSLNSDLNKIRSYGYELERAGTRQDWKEFYDDMVVPHATRRFEDFAWVPSSLFLRLLRRWGTLHFIRRAGRRVAGFCALTHGRRAWFPVLGALPDPALRREGVLAAVYAFTLEWARANAFGSIDTGRSSAFVEDGVGKYKKKWGFQPTCDPVTRFFAVRAGAAACELFAKKPIYAVTEDGLEVYAGDAS